MQVLPGPRQVHGEALVLQAGLRAGEATEAEARRGPLVVRRQSRLRAGPLLAAGTRRRQRRQRGGQVPVAQPPGGPRPRAEARTLGELLGDAAESARGWGALS